MQQPGYVHGGKTEVKRYAQCSGPIWKKKEKTEIFEAKYFPFIFSDL